jgi:vitamin-K-epoxide reductase (warfarin-sensitive)
MRYLIALLALAGVIDSALALRIHLQDPSQAPPCAVTEKFDCGTVNHGPYAVFPPDRDFSEDPTAHHVHIPIAIAGILGYALIGVAALFGRLWICLQLTEIGFFCAAFLSYIEAYVIQKWCIYCLYSMGIVSAILLVNIVALLLRHYRKPPTHPHIRAIS